MRAAGISPPYGYTTMTLDTKYLLNFGIGVAAPKAAAGSLLGRYGPAIAAKGVRAVAGPPADAHAGAAGTTAAAIMVSPPGVAVTVMGAASFLVNNASARRANRSIVYWRDCMKFIKIVIVAICVAFVFLGIVYNAFITPFSNPKLDLILWVLIGLAVVVLYVIGRSKKT